MHVQGSDSEGAGKLLSGQENAMAQLATITSVPLVTPKHVSASCTRFRQQKRMSISSPM